MATIDTVAGNASGATNVTRTELTGADGLLFKTGTLQRLVLENTGSGTPTINILGDAATTFSCGGLGDPVDVSGGFDVSLAATGSAGDVQIIPLHTIAAYLSDSTNMPDVTGGTSDVVAYIIES